MNYLEIKPKRSLRLLVIPFACAVLCGSSYAVTSSDPSGVAEQQVSNVAGTHAQQTMDSANLANQLSAEELKQDESLLQSLSGGVIPMAGGGAFSTSVPNNDGNASDTEPKPELTDHKENPSAYVQQYSNDTIAMQRKLDKANENEDIETIKTLGPEYKKRMYTLDKIGKDLKKHNPKFGGLSGNYSTIYEVYLEESNFSSSALQLMKDAPMDPDKEVLLSLGFPADDLTNTGSEDATDPTSGSSGSEDATDETSDTAETDEDSTQEGDAEAGIGAVCGGNFGGKNGAKAMLERLQSAECQAALEADPSIKAEASVDQVVAGLAKWQSVVNGSSKYFLTIQGIGIENLTKLGIHIWPKYTQAEVELNYADASKAVQAQQDVKNQTAIGDSAAATEDGPKVATDNVSNFSAAN